MNTIREFLALPFALAAVLFVYLSGVIGGGHSLAMRNLNAIATRP